MATNNTKVTKIEGSEKFCNTISGFFKSVKFDNGSGSFSFVVDRTLCQAFALKGIGEKLTDNQQQFVEYSTLKFSRDDVQRILDFCVQFLEDTKTKQ